MGATLLIVDDNDVNRNLLVRRLQQSSYRVIDTDNGAEALELAAQHGVDLVLLDILMPGMDGYRVLEQLRMEERTRAIPVIMLTAVHEVDSVVRCFELGADDYLTKPYNIPFVRSRVAACLRGHSSQLSNMKQVADGTRLLVVDDNPMNRDMLQRRLESEGYQVTTAHNGKAALKLVGQHEFDLILLDILMPEMDGYEVLRVLKDSEEFQHIPVIMLTAVHEAESVRQCIDQGAADYLLKPFNTILLKARIDAVLEESAK